MNRALLESLLFVRGEEGATLKELNQITPVTEEELKTWQLELEQDDTRGLCIKQFGQSFKMVTKAQFESDIKAFVDASLITYSQAQLEVLAIIAYQQPITKVEVEEIRGVSSDGPLQTLIQRQLITEQGRLEQIGRPIIYGTTEQFLDKFGLKTLSDLPPLEIKEAAEEDADLFMSQFKEVFS